MIEFAKAVRSATGFALAAALMASAAPAVAHDIGVPHNHDEELIISQAAPDAEKPEASTLETSDSNDTPAAVPAQKPARDGTEAVVQ